MPRRASACPCDLGDAGARYDACCGPYHAGAEPEDAPTLMRSRYAAFAKGELAYLWRTLHPDHEDRSEDEGAWAERLRGALRAQRYRRLRVLDERGPDASGAAEVLFHVTMSRGRKDLSFAERSVFLRDAEGWRYLAGEGLPNAALPRPLEVLTLASFAELQGA
ncbi:MAG: YchJ family metal-binding protein [Myxococcota bacterium]